MTSSLPFDVRAGGFSLLGAKTQQQDRWLALELPGGVLCAVADGMSSSAYSDIVAEISCSTFIDVAARKWESMSDALAGAKRDEVVQTALQDGVEAAVHKAYLSANRYSGAGAAFAGFFLSDDGRLAAVQIGDVKIWRCVAETWSEISTQSRDTIEHTLRNYLGQHPDDLRSAGCLNVKSLGEDVAGVLCATDGFWKSFEPTPGVARLLDEAKEAWHPKDSRQRACYLWARELALRAEVLGKDDNVTVVAASRVACPSARLPWRPVAWGLSLAFALGLGVMAGSHLARSDLGSIRPLALAFPRSVPAHPDNAGKAPDLNSSAKPPSHGAPGAAAQGSAELGHQGEAGGNAPGAAVAPDVQAMPPADLGQRVADALRPCNLGSGVVELAWVPQQLVQELNIGKAKKWKCRKFAERLHEMANLANGSSRSDVSLGSLNGGWWQVVQGPDGPETWPLVEGCALPKNFAWPSDADAVPNPLMACDGGTAKCEPRKCP